MRLEPATKEEVRYIKKLYRKSFPRAERKPFWFIHRWEQRKAAEVLIIKEDEDVCGLAIISYYGELVLLNYFAIDDSRRNGGLGSRALQLIRERYCGKRLILEIESVAEHCEDNDMRMRRKEFYLRNGFRDAYITVKMFGVDLDVMTGGSPLKYSEYVNLYQRVYGRWVRRFIKKMS